jgi:hypothetical protein
MRKLNFKNGFKGQHSEMTLFNLTTRRLGLFWRLTPDDPPDLSLPHQHILGMINLKTLSFSKAMTLLSMTFTSLTDS